MKFIDKLKNALFEEEYVEIEEKPKKDKAKKDKKVPSREESVEHKESRRTQKKEAPIAKKIAPAPSMEEDLVISDNSFKFPMIDDDEFDGHKKESEIHEEVKYYHEEEKPKKRKTKERIY